jgi:two-component system, NarL family, nitrate/nitrite response regulator NarL
LKLFVEFSGMVNTTVLIDDSDIDLFIQKRFLEVYQFSKTLTSYRSAEEALEKLNSAKGEVAPDVIFLDLNMPNVDGFGFLEGFNSLPQSIKDKSKIVVLTSSNSQKDRAQAFSHQNVVHFVTKPLKQADIEELKKIVRPNDPTIA